MKHDVFSQLGCRFRVVVLMAASGLFMLDFTGARLDTDYGSFAPGDLGAS